MRTTLLILSVLLLWSGCTKETQDTIENEVNPKISAIPEINLLSVNQDVVTEFQDSLVFTISYLDGDGDLGSADPDKTSIELIDQRDPDILVFLYHLSPRGPENSGVALEGTLDVILDNTIILDDANDTETTTFKIRIQDEAGNWSNEVESPVITINKDA
jgi:hypothetical protein